jgi:hypothetical protein
MNDHNTYCVVEKPEADRVGWSRLSHLVNAKKSCQSFRALFTAAQESILCPLHHDEAVHCMGANRLRSLARCSFLDFEMRRVKGTLNIICSILGAKNRPFRLF